MNEKDIRTILGSFLFRGQDVEKTTAQLSGGEKARLALAKLSLEHDNVLLLDEPTNHLDIDSKEVLEQALIQYDGTLFFVSHDRYFINQVATAILEITPEKNTLYLGDYDYYLEKKKEMEELDNLLMESNEEKVPETMSQTKKDYHETKEIQKQLRSLKRKVDEKEQALQEVDEKIEAIHQELAKEEVYTNIDYASELQYQLQDLEEQQMIAMNEWEEAAIALEKAEED